MSKQEKINTKKPLDLAEKASEFLYQARARVYAARILLETPDSDFESQGFKQDCLFYQIDDAHELMKHYESLLNDAATDMLRSRRGRSVEASAENST